jgi:hypothetical protein
MRCSLVDVQEDKRQKDDSQDPAEKLLFHLLRHPYDLIDTRRLMRQFHASAADFQRALRKFEQSIPSSTEKPAY